MSTKGEIKVVFKGLIAAAVAVAMSATPAVAAANTAAAASAAAQIAPAGESIEGSELRGNRRGGFIIPLLAIIAIILGILAATGNLDGDDDDLPTSP